MHVSVKPLLKWVGGKRQLLPSLRQFYPPQFSAYIEPFFGSGAVFFDLWEQGRIAGHRAILIDSNPDLIGCYQMVRDTPTAVAEELERLASGHARGGRAHYTRCATPGSIRFGPSAGPQRVASPTRPLSPRC